MAVLDPGRPAKSTPSSDCCRAGRRPQRRQAVPEPVEKVAG
ncbi:hypothetical protein ACTMU2_12460 [Cupriavidus basilensis]